MAKDIPLLPSFGLDGVGTAADQHNPRIAKYCIHHGIGRSISVAGASNYDRTALETRPVYGLDKAAVICPDPAKVAWNGGFNGKPEFARSQSDLWVPLNAQLNDVHAAAVLSSGCENPFCVWCYSNTSGHLEINHHRLPDLHGKLPFEKRLGVTVYPAELYLRERLAELYTVPLRYWQEGLLLVTLVTDNQSELIRIYGQDYADQLLAFGISQTLAASHHSRANKNASDCFTALGTHTPICTAGWGTRRLLPGHEPRLFSLLRKPFGFQAHGQGIVQDIIDRSVEAAFDSIEKREWRAMDEPYDENTQAFCFVSHPKFHDPTPGKRIIHDMHARITTAIVTRHPNVLVQFLEANGISLPKQEHISPLWVTASTFWPVSFPPRAVLEQMSKPPTKAPQELPPTNRVTVEEVIETATERSTANEGTRDDSADTGRTRARVRRLPAGNRGQESA